MSDMGFDVAGGSGEPATPKQTADPLRPEPVRGRYRLPDPVTGKPRTWQRATSFTKLFGDEYNIVQWKQRNVVVGLSRLIATGELDAGEMASLDVKADRNRLNEIVAECLSAADAYRMSDEGTALHGSTEIADLAGGSLDGVPDRHREKVRLYLDALAVYGLTVADGMIERRVVSLRHQTCGTFDRIFLEEVTGEYVMGDLKTGDSLDLSMPSIAAQLECYVESVNAHGVWGGAGYDTSIRVREDYAYVIHLPSTRDEVAVHKVDISAGYDLNNTNRAIRHSRRTKALDCSEQVPTPTAADGYWHVELARAGSRDAMLDVVRRAKVFGHWNGQMAEAARFLAARLDAE